MKRLLLRLAFLAVLLFRPADGAAPPNVIFILADDQGSVDLGCYGATDLHTPHTDALAARGVRFTQFYSAAPVCSPSRAGALTGRWPARAGVPGNVASQKGGRGGLPPAERTMAEVVNTRPSLGHPGASSGASEPSDRFADRARGIAEKNGASSGEWPRLRFKAAGYATAHIGKWHLGYTPETSPRAQGFVHSFGHMGGCIDNYSHFFYWQGPNVHDLWRNDVEVHHDGEFFPDLMVKEASQFMDQHRERPCFIYYALNSPHYPYQGDAKWLERFKGLPYPRQLYAAFVAAQDERLGAIFAKVDALGLRENTIVIFQSDNGHSTEERAHFGGGSAGPYRGAKFSLFEGGIRLPAIIAWPRGIPRGEVRDQMAHACDWLPTLADLTGISLAGAALDGRSLAPVLRSSSAPSPHADRALHWQLGGGAPPDWAVRLGDRKLIGSTRDTNRSDAQWYTAAQQRSASVSETGTFLLWRAGLPSASSAARLCHLSSSSSSAASVGTASAAD